ncbi:MAG TPA: hypothetical protein PKU94_01900 [Candidatus Hydrothermia bacterium]|nr:hypothetical protein [Candidatus Hydrothermia bacterium]HOP32119.1 hypothetical protein [Candidatus Hydrothermia bacterium]
MEETIKKVLKLLEDGKISPQEAERLIKAIKESTSGEEKPRKIQFTHEHKLGNVVSDVFTSVTEAVGESIESAIHVAKTHHLYENLQLKPVKTIRATVLGGDAEISSHIDPLISANFWGNYNESENSVNFTIVSKGVIKVSRGSDVEVSVLGGNVEINGDYGDMNLRVKGGDIHLDVRFNKIYLNIMGGDVKFTTPRKPIRMNVKKIGGDIKLPPEFVKIEEGLFVFGEGEYKNIDLKILGGDFELVFREE